MSCPYRPALSFTKNKIKIEIKKKKSHARENILEAVKTRLKGKTEELKIQNKYIYFFIYIFFIIGMYNLSAKHTHTQKKKINDLL